MKSARLLPVILAVLLCAAGCSGSKDFTSTKDKRELFDLFFGFAPPEALQDISGHRVWFGDTFQDWIRFPSDPALFERIAAVTKATPVDRSQLDEGWKHDLPDLDAPNPNAPTWWPAQPKSTIQMLYFVSHPYSKERSQADHLYFWRDTRTGTVFAHYVASR